MIRKFRKKPVVIEAIQWSGNSNKQEIDSFVGRVLNTELESETAYLAGKGAPFYSFKDVQIFNESCMDTMSRMPDGFIDLIVSVSCFIYTRKQYKNISKNERFNTKRCFKMQ